ncbi:MAG TPA: transposase [Cyclobacteriaceae bacterium]|nr:transposase [Cyclobacteriaceae bacterium]
MSRKYKFWDDERLYFISYAVVHWIDVFIRVDYKYELLECWKYCCKDKGLEIYGWCIMPSHVHMIIGTNKDKLEDIVRDMKSYTSRRMRKAIQEHPQESRREWMLWMMERAGRKNGNNNNFQFWQQHNQPIELNTNKLMDQTLEYIHNNPVESGFVDVPEEWLFSSSRDYAGRPGLLDIKFIE